ncbi:peptidoglycan DD-metalloendopeptidase family protein [Frankia sp. R82]|uniref:peptidoglycan DD-metalloendopeptidase family protein n=1 Tax=Frankia sp. R82 TaxID=2950553 RepID=UPI0020430A6A|nr:peptidoglycan DD-metalloendopeptidase family protein [Frankia sp. R82]MCM3887211.1 peptidoglycan DD-metalloendopeptidase family protein [Frankia sp. R82]
MPRTPRPDPWWFVVPTIAILIALGWPSRLPVNPRAQQRTAVLVGRPAPAAGPTAEPVDRSMFGLVADGTGGAARREPIRQALAVPADRATPEPTPAPSPAALSPAVTATTASPVSVPRGAGAISASASASPPSGPMPRESIDPLLGPTTTRSGVSRRPALPPLVATRPGGSAAPPVTLPPGAGPPSGSGASPKAGAPTPVPLNPDTATGARPALRWPLAGQVAVSRAFERPATPFGPGHRGVDLPALPGSTVRAVADGTVSFAGSVAGRGVVTLTHGDLRTTYEPVLPGVRVGTVLRAGEPLGTLVAGHAGCPQQACLHWGLLRGSEYLDPLSAFRRVPPRLLPLGIATR